MDLVAPTTSELRLLPPSAVALWRALMRERDDRGYRGGWFIASLEVLRRRARLPTYHGARWALRVLRRAGLVHTRRSYRMRWVSRACDFLPAAVELWYSLEGEDTRRGLLAPREPWRRLVAARRAGPLSSLNLRAVNAPPHPSDLPNWLPADTAWVLANLPEKPKEVDVLGTHCSRSPQSYSIPSLPESLTETQGEKTRDALSTNSWEVDLLRSTHAKLPPPVGDPPRLPPLDGSPDVDHDVDWLHKRMPEVTKVRMLVESFRAACTEILGVEWKAFLRGGNESLRRSKIYERLTKAADRMLFHSVAPLSWARWRLKYLRDKRGQKTPPPVGVIFCASTVDKLEAFFRHNHDKPDLVRKPLTRRHLEQQHRRTEAWNRWRGAWPWMGVEPWYAQMREQEIADGYLDPLERYPRLTYAESWHRRLV